jgi:hypothetical protein
MWKEERVSIFSTTFVPKGPTLRIIRQDNITNLHMSLRKIGVIVARL